MSRQIVLDTETTGLLVENNNRILEIGCVEIVDRKITGSRYQKYINPERPSEPGALRVHGLTEEFLSNMPLFGSISAEFIDYIRGAELIIHNAPFDIGFLNHELSLLKNSTVKDITDICEINDSLVLAKEIYPGARNSLDALCTRLGVNNDNRDLHGALLDSEILAEVYLYMTGGQSDMDLGLAEDSAMNITTTMEGVADLPKISASEAELTLHQQFIAQF